MRKLFVFITLVAILLSGCNSLSSSNSTNRVSEQTNNIKELSFLREDTVTLNVGKKSSTSYVNVSVRNRKEFSPSDVVFVSDNPEVATIHFTKDALTTYLYYEIVAVGPGETEVYAKSKDGNVESKHRKVIVPEPDKSIKVETVSEVETISIDKSATKLFLGESLSLKASVLPKDAKDRTVKWASSDESVAVVNSKGEVIAVSNGIAEITASTSNGVKDTVEISVDGTKRAMKLNVIRKRVDYDNIGSEWAYLNEINGERTRRIIMISIGDTLQLHSKYTEFDDMPDIGEAYATHTVTEDDFKNGFDVTMDVYVTENGGRNSGKSAHFVVTYKFFT